MLDRLIRGSIRNRLAVVALAAGLLAVGGWVALRMPVDVFPDLTAPTVTVLTEAHGMAPEEVELLVTFPIETAVNGATAVRRVRSSTSQGISIVWVEFDWGTDIFRARQTVSEKLQLVASALPPDVGPPVLAPVTSIMGEVLLVAVTGDERVTPMEMRTVADWTIRRRLLAVPGVAQVIPLGGDVRQYQVHVHPDRLAAHGVTLTDVVRTAGGSNLNASGGLVAEGGQEYLLRGIGRAGSLEEIGATVVARRAGGAVLIRDVADVEVGPAVRIGEGSANARPAVILSIQKQPETNTIELTERIDATLAAIAPTLPEGMSLNPGIFRQADFIGTAVENVLEALRDGAILVVAILFLFLWSGRTTFISVLAIPLSLVASVLVLSLLGITINTMTLGGMAIAIGALVDDAVIDVENVFRSCGRTRQRPEAERESATRWCSGGRRRSARQHRHRHPHHHRSSSCPSSSSAGSRGGCSVPWGSPTWWRSWPRWWWRVTVTPALASYLLPGSRAAEPGRGDLGGPEPQGGLYARVGWSPPCAFIGGCTVAGLPSAVLGAAALIPSLGRSFLPEFQEGTLVN
jgi:Cu/Ag efflux pump CusA